MVRVSSTMIAFPWFLLAAGILIVIIGCFFADLRKLFGSGRRVIDPAMTDDEIRRILQSGQRLSLPNLVVLFGLLCILVSIVWRMVLLSAWAGRAVPGRQEARPPVVTPKAE